MNENEPIIVGAANANAVVELDGSLYLLPSAPPPTGAFVLAEAGKLENWTPQPPSQEMLDNRLASITVRQYRDLMQRLSQLEAQVAALSPPE